MARSEQLRQLAVQLASPASLEDVVTHGLHSFTESPSRLVAPLSFVEGLPAALLRPRSRSRSPLPKALPGRSRGSILLSQRGPTGLSVKSCSAAPPDRSVSTHRRSGSQASAVGSVEPRSAAGAASPSAPSEPRVEAVDPSASATWPACLVEVATLAPLRLGVANVTSTAGERDATPSVRCGAKFSFNHVRQQ